MLNILKPFDYIAYRVTAFNVRRWHEDPSVSTGGVVFVTFIQLSLISVAYSWVVAFTLGPSLATPHPNKYMWAGALLMAYNLLRYWKIVPYEKLEARWGMEDPNIRKHRFWLILALCAILPVSLVAYNFVWQR